MYEKLVAAIQQGDFAATKKIINELLDAGESPNEIIDSVIQTEHFRTYPIKRR